jgi:hypothetical protein
VLGASPGGAVALRSGITLNACGELVGVAEGDSDTISGRKSNSDTSISYDCAMRRSVSPVTRVNSTASFRRWYECPSCTTSPSI